MRFFTRSWYRAGLIGGAALAFSLAPMNVRGQQVSTQTSASTQTTATGQQSTNPDLRNWELARMDQFLDDHQDINKDLTAKPSLINDQNYLAQHRDLRLFLNDHPQVREEFAENPTNFMNQERRFETSVRDREQDRARPANGQNPNPDLRNWELARMDQFLDDHQQIDKELAANPSLVNNQNYLAQHQDLKLFLNDHPQVREEFAENPTYFMNQEKRFDTQEELRSRTGQNVGQTDRNTNPDRDRDMTNPQNGNVANNSQDRDQDRDRNFTDRDQDRDRDADRQNPNPDLRNSELARMDQFLDDHKQIDKELTAKPSLINDQKYLASHKDLQTFLGEHPQVREEFTENPSFFMNRENQLEGTNRDVDRRDRDRDRNLTDQDRDRDQNATDQDRDRDRNVTDRDRNGDRDADERNPNPDLRNWELARMDQFLDDHQQIDKELTAKPSLINDQKYLGQHKDLQLFMNEHPQVREEFAENPSFFMNRENRFEARENVPNRNANPDRDRDRDVANSRNENLTDKQAKQMDQFLDKHKDVDRDLAKNPSLCNDDKYLKHHKDLRVFLNKNPEVRTQVASNSAYFTQRHERMEQHHFAKPVKPAPTKTPIEQHETTSPATPH